MASRTQEIIDKLMRALANRQITHIPNQLHIYIVPIKLTVEIPPAHPAQSSIQTKMSLQLCQFIKENETNIMIFTKQIWAVVDIYVTQPLSIDGYLQISKNGDHLGDFPSLNALNITNPGRHTLPLLPPELTIFESGDALAVHFVPLGANNSTKTIIESATINVIIIDFTSTNLPNAEVSMIAYLMRNI